MRRGNPRENSATRPSASSENTVADVGARHRQPMAHVGFDFRREQRTQASAAGDALVQRAERIGLQRVQESRLSGEHDREQALPFSSYAPSMRT